jgi:hypothetical protein
MRPNEHASACRTDWSTVLSSENVKHCRPLVAAVIPSGGRMITQDQIGHAFQRVLDADTLTGDTASFVATVGLDEEGLSCLIRHATEILPEAFVFSPFIASQCFVAGMMIGAHIAELQGKVDGPILSDDDLAKLLEG